jgi:hypothetical protein
MTTALESFRNPPRSVEVTPLLNTAQPTIFGQSDVQGNIAYFNEIEWITAEVDQNLIVPLGLSHIASAFTIPTDGALHEITTLTSELNPTRIPVNANGEFLIPIPGHYLISVSLGFGVTPTGTDWLATVAINQNGTNTALHNLSYPTGTNAVSISYNTQLFLSSLGAFPQTIGIMVAASTITAGSIPACEAEITYIGNVASNTVFHPASI